MCFIASLFLFRKWSVFLILLLIAPIAVLENVFATGNSKPFLKTKPGTKSVRIMQWNCQHLPGILEKWDAGKKERASAVSFISDYQPDIICIQDFSLTKGAGLRSNVALFTDTLKYPFYVFNRHFYSPRPWGDSWTGVAIFSRLLIVRSGTVRYPGKKFPETKKRYG